MLKRGTNNNGARTFDTSTTAGTSAGGGLSSMMMLNYTHLLNTLKGNSILLSASFSVGLVQLVGIFVSKTKKISFAISSVISLFLLFFVSLFPLIIRFGTGLPVTLGNIFAHIANPINLFVCLLIQTIMNFIETMIPDVSPYNKKDTPERSEERNGTVEGYRTSVDANVSGTKDNTAKVEIGNRVFYKNVILLGTSITTFIYLLLISAYGVASSFVYNIMLLVYLGFLTGYSYYKYEIYMFYRYYITDDF